MISLSALLSAPTRHPKNKEHLMCIYLATRRLVNALSYINPVEEASGTWLAGLALDLHRILVMHSEKFSLHGNFYCISSGLCTHMFFNNTSIYACIYVCLVIAVSKFHKTSSWKVFA